MEKAPLARPSLFSLTCCMEPYPLTLWIHREPVVRAQATPAAAERPERQRPSERGGVISPEPPFSPVHPAAAFPLPHEALS